jgi:imidazoleglycerol-phosphate dehydratase
MIELELLTISLINSTMAGKTEQRVRSAALARDTNETKIQLAINIDGGAFPKETDSKLTNGADGHATQASKSQTIAINSGIGFLDHMLHALAKHAGWSLALNCKGDLHSRYSDLIFGVEANAWICS